MNIQTGFCAVVAGILFTACAQGEFSADPDNGKGSDGTLNITGVSLNAGTETRATEPDRTLNGAADRIGIFLKADDANGYAAVNNRLYTYATPFWQTDDQLLLNKTSARLSAYYPYSESGASNPVLLRSQLYAAAQDLCYAPFDASSVTASVSLRLVHAYSRIKFNLARDASLTTAGVVSRLTVTGTGIRSVAQLDLFDATDAAITDLPEVVPGVDFDLSGWADDARTLPGTGAPLTVDGLFVPGTLTGEISLTVIVDDVEKKGRVAATALCGASGQLLAGKIYEVNLTVKEEKALVIDGIKVTSGWDDFNGGTPVEGETH